MYRLDKTGNCVFSLCYHLIVVVKYRRKVFENAILVSDVKTIVQEISESMQVEIRGWFRKGGYQKTERFDGECERA